MKFCDTLVIGSTDIRDFDCMRKRELARGLASAPIASCAPSITQAAQTAGEPNAPTDLATDLLWGAEAIGHYIGQSKRRIYHDAELKRLPIGRSGATLVASRKALKEHFSNLTGCGDDQSR